MAADLSAWRQWAELEPKLCRVSDLAGRVEVQVQGYWVVVATDTEGTLESAFSMVVKALAFACRSWCVFHHYEYARSVMGVVWDWRGSGTADSLESPTIALVLANVALLTDPQPLASTELPERTTLDFGAAGVPPFGAVIKKTPGARVVLDQPTPQVPQGDEGDGSQLVSPVAYAVHKPGEAIYGDTVTVVSIDDEVGGPFILVKNQGAHGDGARIDFEEWAAVDRAVRALASSAVRLDPAGSLCRSPKFQATFGTHTRTADEREGREHEPS